MKGFIKIALIALLLLFPLVAQADTVTITVCTWNDPTNQLTVKATSSDQPVPTLNATGYGNLVWSAVDGYYQRIFNGVASQPDSVTVTSTGGGSDTYYFVTPAPSTQRRRVIQLNF